LTFFYFLFNEHILFILIKKANMKLKKYYITIQDLSKHYFSKNNIEFEYLDNSKKTIKDLKNLICELYYNDFCPCKIKLYYYPNKNDYDYYFSNKKYKKNFFNYEDKDLLSSLKQDSINAEIITDNICNCSEIYKQYLKLSKESVLEKLNEANDIKKDLEKKNGELKENILNLKDKINIKEESILKMKQEENESKIKIKNLENDLQEKIKKIKTISEEKNNYIDNLKKINLEKDKLEKDNKFKSNNIDILGNEKIKLKEDINKLQKQILNSEKQCFEKDKIIEKMEKENKKIENDFKISNEEINKKNKEIDKIIIEKNIYKKKNNELHNEINNLKTFNQNQNDSIKKLKEEGYIAQKKIEHFEKEIKINNKTIEKISKEKEICLDNLKKIRSEKSQLEKKNELNKKDITSLRNENEELQKNIKNLEEENKELKLALKENPESLKRFQELGYLKKIEIPDNSTQIDSKTNKLKPSLALKKEEYKNFYDVVIDVSSVKNISQGWKIEMDEKGEKKFKECKDKESLRLGVIGNSNKGKSFILSRISKIDLASGYYINTKGLSIKYPELDSYKYRNIVLLDSAGLETPVLNDENFGENNTPEKINDNLVNKEINNGKEVNGNIESYNKNELQSDNDLKKNIFMEKSKEKLITELFLQKYIILYSDILILVVGILTYSEQKLINKILDEIKNLDVNKKIFIVHNLKELFTKEQVEDYIKKTLLKSVTFSLVERQYIGSEYTRSNNSQYKRYFVEKNDDNNKKNVDIFHLIFANEDSEAGKFYNRFALDFIENEKKIEFNDDNDILTNKIIKLKNQQNIVLKRCLIDEFGLWNLKKNGFEPKYNCYKKENNLIVKIEVPGSCDINSDVVKKGEFTIIKINGEKKNDKEEIDRYFNTRVFGEFNFEIVLNVGSFEIKNQKPKIKGKNGIITLKFEIEGKAEKTEFTIDDNDED